MACNWPLQGGATIPVSKEDGRRPPRRETTRCEEEFAGRPVQQEIWIVNQHHTPTREGHETALYLKQENNGRRNYTIAKSSFFGEKIEQLKNGERDR